MLVIYSLPSHLMSLRKVTMFRNSVCILLYSFIYLSTFVCTCAHICTYIHKSSYINKPLEKEMTSHSSVLAGKYHGLRSMVVHGGHKELDAT